MANAAASKLEPRPSRAWHRGEPTLEEMLAEPAIRQMMESDHVEEETLRQIVFGVRQQLRSRADLTDAHARTNHASHEKSEHSEKAQ
jgi:hypothetical protein